MTDKEFKKLKKYELLDIILHLQKDLDRCKEENELLKRQLAEAKKNSISSEDVNLIMKAVKKILNEK